MISIITKGDFPDARFLSLVSKKKEKIRKGQKKHSQMNLFAVHCMRGRLQ